MLNVRATFPIANFPLIVLTLGPFVPMYVRSPDSVSVPAPVLRIGVEPENPPSVNPAVKFVPFMSERGTVAAVGRAKVNRGDIAPQGIGDAQLQSPADDLHHRAADERTGDGVSNNKPLLLLLKVRATPPSLSAPSVICCVPGLD